MGATPAKKAASLIAVRIEAKVMERRSLAAICALARMPYMLKYAQNGRKTLLFKHLRLAKAGESSM
jgi:hypothetical protein